MTRYAYGEFSVDIPTGWVDSSTIAFCAPRPASAIPLLVGSQESLVDPPTLMIRRSKADKGPGALERFSREQEEMFARMRVEHSEIKREVVTWKSGEESVRGLVSEYQVHLGQQLVNQIQVCFWLGPLCYIVSGTIAAEFDATDFRQSVIEAAMSLQIED